MLIAQLVIQEGIPFTLSMIEIWKKHGTVTDPSLADHEALLRSQRAKHPNAQSYIDEAGGLPTPVVPG